MDNLYAYSLNGSDWLGQYKFRNDARAAAIAAALQQPQSPGMVYVGKIVPASAQSAHHSPMIIREMHERAQREGINHYLSGLSPEKMLDLEQGLKQTIDAWLDRHHLRPAHFSVHAISEYPAASVTAMS